jgi:hypothetical protein
VTLKSASLIGKDHPIHLQDLPATLRDAIIVTRRLGYRNLWVDSLCIVQDARSDWIAESGKMKDYYRNALFTIAADVSSGDDEGFLHRTRPDRSQKIEVPFKMGNLKAGLLLIRENHVRAHQSLKSSPLSRRAWTLQESILSPRVVHFAKEE